jgi:prepilin-type N-terminal cleavage/methylation domain-containing protein
LTLSFLKHYTEATMKHRKLGFTLVELLIVVVIIGVLATLTVLNTVRTRMQAHDASRRTSVDGYSAALEQWRTASSTKSYFVQIEGAACNAKNLKNAQHDPSVTGYGYMDGVEGTCVGFNGGGAGRMTRKGFSPATGGSYPANSIADALKTAGYLNAVRLDPRIENQGFSYDDPGADFILTTCDADGYAAASPSTAVNYTIYTNLELPSTTPEDETVAATHQCGGSASPGGWNVIR